MLNKNIFKVILNVSIIIKYILLHLILYHDNGP